MPLQSLLARDDLTRKERVIARVLGADYPAAGLTTVAALAERAKGELSRSATSRISAAWKAA